MIPTRVSLALSFLLFAVSCTVYPPEAYGLVKPASCGYYDSGSSWSSSPIDEAGGATASASVSTGSWSPASESPEPVQSAETAEERRERLAWTLGGSMMGKLVTRPMPEDDVLTLLFKAAGSAYCDALIEESLAEAFPEQSYAERQATALVLKILLEDGPGGFECKNLAKRGSIMALEARIQALNPELGAPAISFASDVLQRIFQ